MCFSASASFGAGIVLSTIGVVSLKKGAGNHQKAFASIPLLFAIQQFTEGFVWLSLSDPSYKAFEGASTYLFLFFAQVVWPSWVPYSILKMEKRANKSMLQKTLLFIGLIVSGYLAFCLFSYPVKANIVGQHISYTQEYPDQLREYGGVFYMIATIFPPFFSSIKNMWGIGIAILLSYLITLIFYTGYIVSVWCFFASLISVFVLVVLFQFKKRNELDVSFNR